MTGQHLAVEMFLDAAGEPIPYDENTRYWDERGGSDTRDLEREYLDDQFDAHNTWPIGW
jgi:hypothetical protein